MQANSTINMEVMEMFIGNIGVACLSIVVYLERFYA